MSNTPPDNAVEQRRKVLKGALAASGVVAMGYSGSALASFQCVTSTTAFNLDGFKKTIDPSSNWAWVKLQVFNTNKGNENQGNWRAVKIPKGSNPSDADSDVNTTSYFFQDNDENDNSPPLLPDRLRTVLHRRFQSDTGAEFVYVATSAAMAGSGHPTSRASRCAAER